jgi:hypothetical protein
MAEFKLGRIRFVWQGDWTTGRPYVADDVVKNGGKSYICKLNHTSSSEFSTDFEASPGKWDIVSDGTSWRGDWEPETSYNPGDVVKYGALVYICESGHISETFESPDFLGLEENLADWTPFATSFDWKGNWTVNTRYRRNDLVKYGGYTYVCETYHISALTEELGLEDDQSKWQTFNSSITYLSDWEDTVRYKLNDVVKYGSNLWICVTPHTSSDFAVDEENWSVFVKGFEFENSWNNATEYQLGDIVTYGGYSYIAKTTNLNKQPTANLADWDVFTTGFSFQGDWTNSTAYKVGHVVRVGGTTYVATVDSTGQTPPNPTFWAQLNGGFKWTNNPQTYTTVGGTNISGTGTSAQFTVVRSKTVYTITVTNGGTGYNNGNQIRILGSSVGGLTPSNDIIITITNASGGVIQPAGITWTGKATSWTSGIAYVPGDVVLLGASSYTCILAHTASSPSRPDNDISATYWSILALGSEAFTLTTEGDLLYYGPNGPQRLPIGNNGQIIRATDGFPAWANYGLINNVVYVGPLGTDIPSPDSGLTIDRPWKTVRYALSQVEDGYLYPNTKTLLRRNKQFLIKEVNNYLSYRKTVTITNFNTTSYEYTVASTANLDEGMPIVFSGTTGGVTAGTTYYVKTIVGATEFTISNLQFGTVRILTGTPPGASMTGTFSYDQVSTERDAGIIVDALVYDITKGGTLQTTIAANAYYTPVGNAYVNTTTGERITQIVEAQQYLKTIVGNVLNNTAPAANYQTLNGVSAGDSAAQIIDSTITAEVDAISKANDLIDIITTGLTAGSATAIPPSFNPNTTVFIKTGTYQEVLPMVIPEYTAIVGDELRTSVIQPARATASLSEDKPKTVSALNRIRAIIPDLMDNNAITPTVGNVESQIYLSGFTGSTGSDVAVTRVSELADVIKNVISSGPSAVPSLKLPNPTDYGTTLTNTAYAATGNLTGATSTYDNARTQIVQNYDFIKAEILAWLPVNHNPAWITFTSAAVASTPNDIGNILDAIRYDITYGGNTQSIVAGQAYFSEFVLQIRNEWLAATVGALGRLKTIVGQIATTASVTATTSSLSTVAITGTAGQFSCASTTLFVGQTVKISGTAGGTGSISGYVNPTTYYIVATNGTTAFTLSTSFGGTGITTTAGTPTGLTYVLGNSVTQVTSGSAGNAASAVFLQDRIQNVIDYINNAVAPATIVPALTWVSANLISANTAIQTKKVEIQEDTVAWTKKFFQRVSLNEDFRYRDAGNIIDGIGFDVLFNSNFASIKSGLTYYRGTALTIDLLANEKEASIGAVNFIKHKLRRAASITSDVAIGTIIDDITSSIDGGKTPSIKWPAPTTIAAGFQGAATLIWDNKSFIQAEVLEFIADNYPLIELNSQDIGYVIDALRYDLTYGGNFASKQIGISYYSRTGTLQIDPANKLETLAVYGYLKTILQSIAVNTPVSSPLQLVVTQTLADTLQTVGSGAANTQLGTLVDVITAIVDQGIITGVPRHTITTISSSTTFTTSVAHGLTVGDEIISQVTANNLIVDQTYYIAATPLTTTFTLSATYGGPVITTFTDGTELSIVVESTKLPSTTWVSTELLNQFKTLNASKASITEDVTTYIQTNYPTLVYDPVLFARDIGLVVDAVGFDLMFNSNYRSILAGRNYYNSQAWLVITNGKYSTVSALRYLKNNLETYISVSSTATSRSNLSMDTIINIILFGAGDSPEVNGSNNYDNNLGVIKGAELLRANAEFLANEATAWVTATFPGYVFDEELCKRDMRTYVDAIVHDLQYAGNYKSSRAASLYLNAVNGSQRSDMFYVRQSTGVRNMTLNGLSGELSEENEYGTRRPTAGAYTSLDPGFGPNDQRAWITTKSPYVQNVTTFGIGCVGCKIDGALHSGGNRSMVSNDFTQVLSDGIGVWCSGANSLTELVSVFAYYNYAGYIADLGGRIRATNGNSSYGTYGVIAEGTDTSEVPLRAIIDNHAQQAQIGLVLTDATDQVYRFEFQNAGTHYTNSVHTISGAGFNAAAIADEFRDAAVFETRLIDLDNDQGSGGEDYVSAINVAQEGTPFQITIANTDTALSTAYIGMRIQLTAGSGVGQYANILTYNNGTKVARVYKDSFTNLTVTATAVTNNLLTVSSTATLTPGMAIYLGTTANGLTANTLYYINTANFSATQFQVSTTAGGSGAAVTITATGSVSITLYAAGWDHAVSGTAINPTLDLTTAYIIEPRISYTAPGYTATARTLSATSTWGSVTYANGRYVSVTGSGTVTQYSTDGKTWIAGGTVPSATWTDVVFGGGSGSSAYAVVGGLGGSGAVFSVTLGTANSVGLPGAGQIAAITVVSGGNAYSTPPTIVITGTGGGATATCTVLDGVIQAVTLSSNGSGYTGTPTVVAVTDRVTEIVVTNWGTGYTAPPTVTLSGGGSSNQATGTAVLTNTGVSSITIGNSGGSGYTSTPTVSIVDTNAKFVVLPNGSTTAAYLPASSAVNANWTSSTTLPASNYTALAYGNGLYIAVGGTSTAASSTDGNTFTARTIQTLGSGTWTDLAYGNGTFIAIPTGSNATSFTTNGITWTVGGNLPSSTTWTSIAYGNGRFVAIASGGRTSAYSLDKGLSWVAAPIGLPSSQTWSKISYGQGLFFAVAQGTSVAATSPDGITWTVRDMPTSSNWRGLAFGNPNDNPLWVATSNTSGTIGASIATGAQTTGRILVASGEMIEVRLIEPGSGYTKGLVSATAISTNVITVNNTENLIDSQPVEFTELDDHGLITNVTYYIIGSTIVTNTSFKVSATAGSATPVPLSTGSNISGTFRTGPIVTQFDPNKTITAALRVRTGDGVLGNPSFINRGTGNTTATAETSGDGYADLYQPSTFITVDGLFSEPIPGSNVEFASIPDVWFKLVSVREVVGIDGNYSATLQISPGLSVLNAPAYGDPITISNKYSQVRLTGHDFLYIGTGNQATTNYPFVDATTAYQDQQELSSGGGRVFFTSTDQDGNFNVGNLFGVQQATGTATLNADAFNLSGLQSLQLGGISLGIGSAVITQFSTDPFFTANSDNVVPTQRAIKAYITAQIGGGQSSLNVNTLTAGVVYVANDTITTTSGGQLNITAKMNFTGGIDGAPVALGFFLQK